MRRLLGILVGLLCGAVAGGLLDGVTWPGPPLALFRPQLTLLLLALALLALAVGPRKIAAAGIAVAALGLVLLILTLRVEEPEPPTGSVVRLLTLNLWHRNDDAAAVRRLIERERPDVVALVELTSSWERALARVLEPYPIRAAEIRAGATGLGLYARARVRRPVVVRLVEGAGPAVEAQLDLPGGTGRLLVVHPPGAVLPGHAAAQERELIAVGRWARATGPRAVVCGDFNAAPWTRSLRDVMEEGALRAALPGGLVAGSWPALVPPLRVAIDGCLVGRDVRARAVLGPRVGSDHLPVLVELE